MSLLDGQIFPYGTKITSVPLPKLAVFDHLTRNERAELKEKRTAKPFPPSHVQWGDRTFRPFLTAKGQHLTPKAMGKLSLLGTHWLNQRSLHVISMELR